MTHLIFATTAGPPAGLEALAVMAVLAATGLFAVVMDRLSRSPKAARLDVMLDRALGGDGTEVGR